MKKQTTKRIEKKPIHKIGVKKAVIKPATKKTVAAAFKGFSPAAFARGCGLTREGVADGIASGRIKVNTSGLIAPDDNGRFLTQKMRLGIRQEIIDAITDKKILNGIKSHFKKTISLAQIKSEQAERLQIEIDELKQKLGVVDLLKGLFVFISAFKKGIEDLKDKSIQNKISELLKANQEREAVLFMRQELQKIIERVHQELVSSIRGNITTEPKRKKPEQEFYTPEDIDTKGKDISVLIEVASRASLDLLNANARLKDIQSIKEKLLTLKKKQILMDFELQKHYYSFVERLMQQAYQRPNEIAPILKTFYMAGDSNMAADHLCRELVAGADQIKKDLLAEMVKDGFQLKNIPHDV